MSKSEIIPYRSSHLDAYLAKIEDDRKNAIVKYARKKAEYIKFKQQNSQFEGELIAAGLNPNDIGDLESILERLDGENGDRSSFGNGSIYTSVLYVSNGIRNQLKDLNKKLIGIFRDYIRIKPSIPDLKNIKLIKEGDFGAELTSLNKEQLWIKMYDYRESPKWHIDGCLHGTFSICLKDSFWKGIDSSIWLCGHHRNGKEYLKFYQGLDSFVEFYVNSTEKENLDSYLNAYLKIPYILAGKLGLEIKKNLEGEQNVQEKR